MISDNLDWSQDISKEAALDDSDSETDMNLLDIRF